MQKRYVDPQTGGYAKLSRFRDGYCIDSIYVPFYERGRGAGKRVLEAACTDANLEKVKLYLVIFPDADSPLQWKELEAWYKRNGFEKTDKGKYVWYKREPQPWAPPVYAARCYEHEPLPT